MKREYGTIPRFTPYKAIRNNPNWTEVVKPFKGMERQNPFPAGMYAEHRYSESIVLTNGPVAIFGGEKVWRLNSLFDPDETGVGHQPYGRDQMAGLYNRYKVLSADVTLTVLNRSGTVPTIFAAMLTAPTDTAILVNQGGDAVRERPNVQCISLPAFGDAEQVFSFHVNIWDVVGMPYQAFKTQMGDNYAPLQNANPSQVVRLKCAQRDQSGAALSGTSECYVQIDIVYKAWWFDRLTQIQS